MLRAVGGSFWSAHFESVLIVALWETGLSHCSGPPSGGEPVAQVDFWSACWTFRSAAQIPAGEMRRSRTTCPHTSPRVAGWLVPRNNRRWPSRRLCYRNSLIGSREIRFVSFPAMPFRAYKTVVSSLPPFAIIIQVFVYMQIRGFLGRLTNWVGFGIMHKVEYPKTVGVALGDIIRIAVSPPRKWVS